MCFLMCLNGLRNNLEEYVDFRCLLNKAQRLIKFDNQQKGGLRVEVYI